jgi:hypothetical protein
LPCQQIAPLGKGRAEILGAYWVVGERAAGR